MKVFFKTILTNFDPILTQFCIWVGSLRQGRAAAGHHRDEAGGRAARRARWGQVQVIDPGLIPLAFRPCNYHMKTHFQTHCQTQFQTRFQTRFQTMPSTATCTPHAPLRHGRLSSAEERGAADTAAQLTQQRWGWCSCSLTLC